MPADDGILLTPSSDRAEGEAPIRGCLSAKNWDELPASELAARWSSVCCLSADAFCCTLRALLISSLSDSEGAADLCHSTVYELTPSALSIYAAGDEYQAGNIQAALDASWLPSLKTAQTTSCENSPPRCRGAGGGLESLIEPKG